MSSKKANKRIFELLKLAGDSLEEKREVTHWLYFDKYADLSKFEQFANEIGFHTIYKRQRKSKNHDSLLLLIGHFELLNEDQTNFDTLEFFEIAPKYNGVYDGWETSFTPTDDDFIENLNALKEEE